MLTRVIIDLQSVWSSPVTDIWCGFKLIIFLVNLVDDKIKIK